MIPCNCAHRATATAARDSPHVSDHACSGVAAGSPCLLWVISRPRQLNRFRPKSASCVAANSISNRQSFDRAGAACGISIGRHVLWKFSRLDQKRSTNATGHLLAIFEKPTVAFEAQNFCVTSTNIQLEFEIKRRSYTALWAVASASIASDRSISDGMEKIR